MAFEDYQTKPSVTIVYTGDGKGKTSASLGLMVRALGSGWRVSYIQFVKYWGVGEHVFIRDIASIYQDSLHFFKGGKGFYKAGDISAPDITTKQHKEAAAATYNIAYEHATSGKWNLVICDEINNAVNDGLITKSALKKLLVNKHPKTSLCLTGRDFPPELLDKVDIATNMEKIKHHFDNKYLANPGIDY